MTTLERNKTWNQAIKEACKIVKKFDGIISDETERNHIINTIERKLLRKRKLPEIKLFKITYTQKGSDTVSYMFLDARDSTEAFKKAEKEFPHLNIIYSCSVSPTWQNLNDTQY